MEDYRYTAEIRVFGKAPSDIVEMDYINDIVTSTLYGEALSEAKKVAKELGGKVKINIIDEERGQIIYSNTRRY